MGSNCGICNTPLVIVEEVANYSPGEGPRQVLDCPKGDPFLQRHRFWSPPTSLVSSGSWEPQVTILAIKRTFSNGTTRGVA
jgi:hypothetical protein